MKILFNIIFMTLITFSFLNAENAFSQKLVSKYTYTISKGNIEFATTINSLYQSRGKLIFEVNSSTSGIFKLKKDIRKERSIFEILDSKVVSSEYTFSRQKKR